MEIKDIKTSDKDYFEIWTSYCGADLTGYINNQCIGELQTFKYNSKNNNLQKESVNLTITSTTTALSSEIGILELECLLFSGTLSRLKPVMNKSLHEFTAKYSNEYGDTLLINFPEIKYDSYSISSSVDKVTTSLIIKYKVYKKPDIFEQYHKIMDVLEIKEKNPLTSISNLDFIYKQQENTDCKLNIYVPKVAYEKDIKKSIDDYIDDKYLYKTAYYNKLDYKQMYLDTIAYTNYPCTVQKGNALIFKGLCYELFEASTLYNKELKKTKEIDDKKMQCNINIYATFDLDSEMNSEEFDSEKEQAQILLNTLKFNMNGQDIYFDFMENKCNIQEDVNYNEAHLELCSSKIRCFNFNDVHFHTAKYLSNVYDINTISFKSNYFKKIKNLHIERITFTDGYNEEFNVNQKVIDEYNKKIGEELIINDTDNQFR